MVLDDVLPDGATTERMLAAIHTACERIGAVPAGDTSYLWGWRGRTVSGPVAFGGVVVWMRLASSRQDQIADTFWRGNHAAAQQLPATIPRPSLLLFEEYTERDWAYAIEVYEHADVAALSPSSFLGEPVSLNDRWWDDLRTALDAVATVPTERYTTRQRFLDRIVPEMLEPTSPVPTSEPWVTAHGDLHWANLAGPDLLLFDWEGWGEGPLGYDAATLLVHSLLLPDLAAEVRARFADVLAGGHGRYAQQVVVSEQLWRRRDTPHDPLLPVLRDYAATLQS